MRLDSQFQFFAYLAESYAQYKGITPKAALDLWDEKRITGFVYDM